MNIKNFFILIFGVMSGILLVCCACFLFTAFIFTAIASGDGISNRSNFELSTSSNKILVVNITGVIMNERSADAFGFLSENVTYGYEIQEELIKAADNTEIKAIVVNVNSPGGTVTGSNAIAEGLAYFKEKTGKPIIGFGSGLIASGGYWGIVPADTIIVDKGSLVGSIGVISGQLTIYNNVIAESEFLGGSITTRDGIEKLYITAGKGKDLGNPYRKPTKEELALLQSQADGIYNDFVNHVVKYRSQLTSKEIKENLGAYIYDTDQAVKLGLIDKSGSKQDAVDAALAAANITDPDYQLIEIPKDSGDFFNDIFGIRQLATAMMQQQPPITCGITSQTLVYHGGLAALCQ